MSDFMSHQFAQGSIARKDCWSHECQAGILQSQSVVVGVAVIVVVAAYLHTAIRKAARKNKNIIPTPYIREQQLLCCFDVQLCLLQFVCGGIDDLLFCPDASARTLLCCVVLCCGVECWCLVVCVACVRMRGRYLCLSILSRRSQGPTNTMGWGWVD